MGRVRRRLETRPREREGRKKIFSMDDLDDGLMESISESDLTYPKHQNTKTKNVTNVTAM